ncbi:WxL domain-containing protein [Enterococcus sp. DIV0876]|uniref:WxL domain-containing protein n=1 Tax=Enterococcus sp. DIV0876 TaxID=2774633 RepID=UPI003D2FF17E
MIMAQAESFTKTSEEQVMSSSEPVISSSENLEETKETKMQESIDPVSSDSNVVVTESPSSDSEDSSEVAEEVQVIFQTDADRIFATGKTSVQIIKNKGEVLQENDLPVFEDATSFEGWSLDGTIYTSEELIERTITENQILIAVFKTSVKSREADISLADQSIKEIIDEADKTKVIAVPSPAGDGSAYAEYTNSAGGIRQALFDMYQNGNGQEFALYVGSGESLTLPATLTSKTIPDAVDNTNMTFYALQGKISRLILTGHGDDPITDTTILTSGSRTVALGTTINFGSDVVIRNLNYTGTTMYMNGNSLSLNGGSTGNGLTIYGGSHSGDVTGDPTITINATGTGSWSIYGGNRDGGTLTGNPTILINNTLGGIRWLSGGAYAGTVNGNITNVIKKINGTLTYFHGGGVGQQAAGTTANVTGSIVNIFNIDTSANSFRFGSYYGGVSNGTINGSITNDISGAGGWTSRTAKFIGGSTRGDVGSSKEEFAIKNKVDTSQHETVGPSFAGGNSQEGTITGSISNTVKAGLNPEQGGIGDFHGGYESIVGTSLTKATLGGTDETIYDSYTPEERANLAFNNANQKILGDIHSHLVSGSFGNYNTKRTTAAGVSGYIEGDVVIELGTSNEGGLVGGEGMVYTGEQPNATEVYYSPNRNTFSAENNFYIASSGMSGSTNTWNVYVKGDTHTIINNAIANTVYGGPFTGVVEGNTNVVLKAGIVGELTGAGENGGRVFGNSTSTVYGGQVDNRVLGGQYNDKKIVGNVSVNIYDGVINASVAAGYALNANSTVTGDSKIAIYGGDFSGNPRSGQKGIYGGFINSSSVLGNTNVTIDVREYEGQFHLLPATYIAGGHAISNRGTIGTDASNTITLNIYMKPGSDALNGARIYGDGCLTASNSRSGQIYMNIQAEGSSIGLLYASYHSIISSSQILKNVEMRVQGAKSFGGISGGSSSDNFTNTIIANSSNQVKMHFGENVDGTASYQTEPIAVTGLGIVNFTELNVTNGIKLMVNGGDIKNGRSATAANHAATYNQFGDIHLSKNAGIGISSAANLISGAKLTVEDEGTIESPPGTGRINISDFATPDTDKDHLTWLKTTTNDAAARVNSQGTWFGTVSAYQVLTVNPNGENARAITPTNFSGIEITTGKTLIGDSDVSNVLNGFGIAIPGSIINYEVETPGIANGSGAISHNVGEVMENNEPVPLRAWGTEQAGVQVQKGRLLIPYTGTNLPTLTFTPETEQTGSWLYAGQIKSSNIDSEDQLLSEHADSEPVDWTSPDGEYSYDIRIQYSNQAEVNARNVIITEQEAEMLTREQALVFLEAKGRPFFVDTLSDEVLNEVMEPLGTAIDRKHTITFTAGENEQNQSEKTVNLVVVRNESVLSDDRQLAVYAKDVRLTLPEANALVDEEDLAAYTNAATIFADNRDNARPTVAPTAFTAIQQAEEAELLKNVSTAYHYEADGQLVEKVVNVAVTGELILSSVPTAFDFGQQKVSAATQTYWPTITEDLAVKDTRGSERSSWRLTVKEQQPLTAGTNQLADVFHFVKNGQEQVITSGEMIIEETELTENGTYVVNQHWSASDNEGIQLTVPVEQQIVGDYQGTLSWQLVSAPGNP